MSIGLFSDVDVKSRTYDVDANLCKDADVKSRTYDVDDNIIVEVGVGGGGRACRSIQANSLS